MTKHFGFFAVMSLLAVGCGGTELEPGDEAMDAPTQAPGSVSAQACVTLYNQSFGSCQTRDTFKMNTASFCPQGYYGSAVTVHDACATPAGTYLSADITCCR